MAVRSTSSSRPGGPLAGLRVLEFAGLGPAPFACMMLSDMGADIVSLVRLGAQVSGSPQVIGRGRKVCEVDLKDPQSIDQVCELIACCDVLVEGYRPGVMERLGLGPEVAMQRNPRLIYGRMTGWGQSGPKAALAGHDINYIALTGALHATGTKTSGPVAPLNLLGDYGGGSLYLLAGVLAALVERNRSGLGQVIDAAITDGVLSMMSLSCEQALSGDFKEERESNLLDGGTPWYGIYETADGKHISVGALEPRFFENLCHTLELEPTLFSAQSDSVKFDAFREALKRRFASKTRDEWVKLFANSDACVAPVLTLTEASADQHHLAREAFVDVEGLRVPAPAPRFSRTPSRIDSLAVEPLLDLAAALKRWKA